MAFPVSTRSDGFFVTAAVWNADIVANENTLHAVQERLKRTSMQVRLTDPVFDVNDAAVVTVDAKPVDGAALVTTTVVTHYTAPGGAAVAVVHRITLCNNDSVANHAAVYLVENGGSPGSTNVIFYDTLLPYETVQLEGPWFLDPSDTVRSYSTTAGAANVGMRLEVTEYSDAPIGATMFVDDGNTLTTSNAAYYTCPGSGVQHSNVMAVTVCNFSGSSQQVIVEIRPSGGSFATKQCVFNAPVASSETVILGGFVLEPGDSVRGVCASNSAATIRVSAVEYAS